MLKVLLTHANYKVACTEYMLLFYSGVCEIQDTHGIARIVVPDWNLGYCIPYGNYNTVTT